MSETLTSPSGRIELKCKVPFGIAHRCLDVLNEICWPDRQGELGGYQVSSLYFDDPFLSQYHSKADGLDLKEKHRLRFYNQENVIYAEAKCKRDKTVQKKRLVLESKADLPLLDILNEIGEREELPIISGSSKGWNGQAPTALITYFRKAYYFPSRENLRLTMDLGVSASTDCPSGLSLHDMTKQVVMPDPELCIFEIKSNGEIPKVFLSIMAGLGIKVETFSKYAYGLEQNPLGKIMLSEQATGA